MIKAIWAMDDNYGIAKDGQIPWYNKEDLIYFKEATIGSGNNIIVMGRKTFESLPNGNLLHRVNIIMTRTPENVYEISTWNHVTELSEMCKDLWIIGGESIYTQALTLGIPEEIHISRIPGVYDCDQFIDIATLNKNYQQVKQIEFETFNLEIWHKV